MMLPYLKTQSPFQERKKLIRNVTDNQRSPTSIGSPKGMGEGLSHCLSKVSETTMQIQQTCFKITQRVGRGKLSQTKHPITYSSGAMKTILMLRKKIKEYLFQSNGLYLLSIS